MLSQPGRHRRGRSQRPVALDYKGGQLQRVLALASVCAVVSEIHSSVGGGEILYQICKEGVSRLKKCREYKGPPCQCNFTHLVKLMLSFGAKEQRENSE